MLSEFERISNAYFSLREQITEFFKAYITLIGFSLTFIAAILRFFPLDSNDFSLSSFPVVLAGLMLIISLLGLFISLSITSMRLGMILYARAINLIRRFFSEQSGKKKQMSKYLVLPTTDTQPPFFEINGRGIFWPFMLMAILDGIIFGFSIFALFNLNHLLCILIGIVYSCLHILFYWIASGKRESEWETHFNKNIGKLNI